MGHSYSFSFFHFLPSVVGWNALLPLLPTQLIFFTILLVPCIPWQSLYEKISRDSYFLLFLLKTILLYKPWPKFVQFCLVCIFLYIALMPKMNLQYRLEQHFSSYLWKHLNDTPFPFIIEHVLNSPHLPCRLSCKPHHGLPATFCHQLDLFFILL